MEVAGGAVQVVPKLGSEHDCREVGSLAVWTVTSAKPGNGVELLRDDKLDTFWQSDGTQPHMVNIQFQKKVRLLMLALYLDFKLDESYTPNKLVVRSGTSVHDLKEVRSVEVEEPAGWVVIPLVPAGSSSHLKAYLLQVAILSNHQNGRDTHVRQIKVFGPREDMFKALGYPMTFKSAEAFMYATVR